MSIQMIKQRVIARSNAPGIALAATPYRGGGTPPATTRRTILPRKHDLIL
ncbi:hypothetical protein EDWATA_02670 [Edwardsiella tarda ATCC 23685]|uniref:Uncharacterized protein n=1 Tax=Edwardsiella tarda ATCC 23685 TaxID=500638 RepID=D4F7D5_EDWTA|nr:hypothetical protein EDWATA_02670 [Edwardsiella tarda ATCC 23685]